MKTGLVWVPGVQVDDICCIVKYIFVARKGTRNWHHIPPSRKRNIISKSVLGRGHVCFQDICSSSITLYFIVYIVFIWTSIMEAWGVVALYYWGHILWVFGLLMSLRVVFVTAFAGLWPKNQTLFGTAYCNTRTLHSHAFRTFGPWEFWK